MRNLITVTLTFLLAMTNTSSFAQDVPSVVHVFVALCDNKHQGIVPVPEMLGNGDDPKNNLYWGAMYGVKSFFSGSPHWKLVATLPDPAPVRKQSRWSWLPGFKEADNPLLERIVFRHTREDVYLVADAYQGRQIKQTVIDFLNAASGTSNESISVQTDGQTLSLNIHGGSNLIVYVGHDGLMDFRLKHHPEKQDERLREVMILACISREYFYEPILQAGARPLLWTTGLMAPEAYTLESAIEGWILQEDDASIHLRAAKAYNKYQKCGLKAAKRLFSTGVDIIE